MSLTPQERGALGRLMAKTDTSGVCWLWQGYTNVKGYGSIKCGDGARLVHRLAYELFVLPIPAGLEIDHLCSVRNCINPDHLEAVTHDENISRGLSLKHQAMKTHCPQGHAYRGANLIVRKNSRGQNYRICRICARASDRRFREKRKQRS